MSALPRLPEAERTRLLGVLGVTRYVPRTAQSPATVETTPTPAPPAARNSMASARPTPPTTRPRIAATSAESAPRASLLDDLGVAQRAPKLLLIVEAPRPPDPRAKPLLDAIRRHLPAHQMIDAGDPPTRWPTFALALGGQLDAAPGTQLIQSPPVHRLRGDGAAKRALWAALRTMLRELRGA